MVLTTRRFLVLALLGFVSSGCTLVTSEDGQTYETVPASPHRNTRCAKVETTRAVKLLDRGGPFGEGSNLEMAEKALRRALVADVTYGPAHNNLGKVYFLQERFYLAAWEFQYAMKLMPERPEPHNNLGLVLEAVGRFDLAIEHFEVAYGLAPTRAEIIGNLVRARIRRGHADDELHELLNELILYDTRPSWVEWAREQQAKSSARTVSTSEDAHESLPESLPVPQRNIPPMPNGMQEEPMAMDRPTEGQRAELEFPRSQRIVTDEYETSEIDETTR